VTEIPGASRLQAAHDANAARLAAADRVALNRLVQGYGAAWRDLQRQLVANLERIQRAQGRDGIVTLTMVLADLGERWLSKHGGRNRIRTRTSFHHSSWIPAARVDDPNLNADARRAKRD
jgi:hypothetical protein